MRKSFDKELDLLKKDLIKMASLVEEKIKKAIDGLIKRDRDLAREVVEGDYEVDNMEREIESSCLKLILRQQPVAGDLRLISSVLKMITDLERIGDNAQDIAEISLLISEEINSDELSYISQMAEATIYMLRKSIDAFVNHDLDLAKKVIEFDDKVDSLFDIIRDKLVISIREGKDSGEEAINLLMISKYLERIGDHGENIAEWVVFSNTGEHIN